MLWAELFYWVGVLCATWCAYDLVVRRRRPSLGRRTGLAFVLLFGSWVGMGAYLFFVRCRPERGSGDGSR